MGMLVDIDSDGYETNTTIHYRVYLSQHFFGIGHRNFKGVKGLVVLSKNTRTGVIDHFVGFGDAGWILLGGRVHCRRYWRLGRG